MKADEKLSFIELKRMRYAIFHFSLGVKGDPGVKIAFKHTYRLYQADENGKRRNE